VVSNNFENVILHLPDVVLYLWIYVYCVINGRHVARMDETSAYSILVWKPGGKLPLGKTDVDRWIILIWILEK
jgi:hypothetical protein